MIGIETVRQRLLARYRAIVAECDQALADTGYWNDRHPNERPLTPDDAMLPFILKRRAALKAIDHLERGERIPDDLFD